MNPLPQYAPMLLSSNAGPKVPPPELSHDPASAPLRSRKQCGAKNARDLLSRRLVQRRSALRADLRRAPRRQRYHASRWSPSSFFVKLCHRRAAIRDQSVPEAMRLSQSKELIRTRPFLIVSIDRGARDYFRRSSHGKERDAETGLDYFGVKYMSSAQGGSRAPISRLRTKILTSRRVGISTHTFGTTRSNLWTRRDGM